MLDSALLGFDLFTLCASNLYTSYGKLSCSVVDLTLSSNMVRSKCPQFSN